ncbi:hypothetical protein PV326_007851 [Microctonus aethiopoides]|nr:hypothetical protein PV326_007851 [Microctonus aethiopoides]
MQGCKLINEDLALTFPGRSLTAIEGQRRKNQHKALVVKVVDEMITSRAEQELPVPLPDPPLPNDFANDLDNLNSHEAIKARWSEEVSLLLARREAQLNIAGKKHLYQSLCRKDGVLPVPSLRCSMPMLRLIRIRSLGVAQSTSADDLVLKSFMESEVRRVERKLNDHGRMLTSADLMVGPEAASMI